MPVYSYKAIDRFGKEMVGETDTPNYDEAIKKLRGLGYFPTQIKLKKEKKKAARDADGGAAYKNTGLQLEIRIPLLGIGTIKSGQVTVFTRQLATLIGAGLPLVRSLNILRDQTKQGTFKGVINSLAQQVEAGGTFSDSLLKYPNIFSKLFVNTVKAGETGGVLEIVLTRLAEFSEKTEKLQARIKSALMYPAFVVLIAIGILSFLMIAVIPNFMELYEEIGADLPLMTVTLLRITDFVRYKWVVGIIGIIGIVIGMRMLMKLPPVKYLIDRMKLRMPVFGILIQKIAIARFSRTLGTLISSGVPILQALTITKDTSGNEVISNALSRVHDSIREGESIAGPLSKTRIFPLMVVNMINVGEETGALDQMLKKIADTYEEEVDSTVAGLASLLEPMLIVFLGLVVGAIVIAMFLPLVGLLTALSA